MSVRYPLNVSRKAAVGELVKFQFEMTVAGRVLKLRGPGDGSIPAVQIKDVLDSD